MWILISTDGCTYCTKAKELLRKHGLPFTEYNMSSSSSRWVLTLLNLSKLKTVPQVFNMKGTHIGGYTELKEHLDG